MSKPHADFREYREYIPGCLTEEKVVWLMGTFHRFKTEPDWSGATSMIVRHDYSGPKEEAVARLGGPMPEHVFVHLWCTQVDRERLFTNVVVRNRSAPPVFAPLLSEFGRGEFVFSDDEDRFVSEVSEAIKNAIGWLRWHKTTLAYILD